MQEVSSSSLYRGQVEVWGGRSATTDMLSEFKKKGRRMLGGNGNSANARMRNQRVLLLLLALAAAVLGVVLLHKLREGRIYGLLLQDRDRQVVGLQLVLQREREKTSEMKRNLEDKRAKISILKIQKMELANKLSESKEMVEHLHRTQEEMEATLSEKQNQINMLSAKTQESTMTTNLQVAALTETVKQKEAEVEEMKQVLMKQTPTPMENNPTAQDESMGRLPNSEGKWVKFQTNADPEGSKAQGGVSEDLRNQKPINSQDQNENSEEGHEMSQASTSEIQEQNEEPKDDEIEDKEKKNAKDVVSQASTTEIQEQSQEPKDDEIEDKEKKNAKDEVSQASTTEIQEQNQEPKDDETEDKEKKNAKDEVSQVSTTEIQEQKKKDARESELQASDGNASEKLEKLDSSQDSSEKQVVPEETKMAGDGEETRTRHGRRNKRRTKRRRKPTSRGRDLERKSEKNEQDGELNGTVTTTTTTVPDENETVSNPTVPDETPVDEVLKTEDQTNSEGKPEGTTEERLDDSNQQKASNTGNQEGAGSATESDTAVPNDTPLEEVSKTEGRGNSEGNTEGATEERRDDSNQQQPNTRNQEGDGDNRIIREEDGKEVTSTEGKSEESENLADDAKNNGSNEKVVDTADFIKDKESGAEKQDGVIKEEEEDAKTTSNIEQAEVQNDGNDHQSQISENTTIDTTGELKEAEGVELTDNAENQNSEDAA